MFTSTYEPCQAFVASADDEDLCECGWLEQEHEAFGRPVAVEHAATPTAA